MFTNKNILFLTHSYANFQKDQIEIIAPHFNKVYVLVRYKPIAEISNYIPLFAAKYHTYKNLFDLRGKPENVTVIPVPLWYLPFDFFYKRLGNYHLRIANNLIKKHHIKFDILHTHFLWTAGYAGGGLKEKYKVPLIITGHGEGVYDYPFRNEFWRKTTIKVLAHADEIITVSKKNYECILRLGFKKNVHIFPNGFSSNLFFPKLKYDCREKLHLPQEKKILLTVGFLRTVKGHKYFIDAIKMILKEHSNILCIIIGEGELHSELQKQIDALHLQNHVVLAGKKNHNALVDWINASDLFVLPSLSESFGVVQIEAMACGKPVVATRNGGSEEILISVDLGFMCEPANAADLAEKIQLALNKEWDTDKILKYAQNYTWENAINEIHNIYNNYLK